MKKRGEKVTPHDILTTPLGDDLEAAIRADSLAEDQMSEQKPKEVSFSREEIARALESTMQSMYEEERRPPKDTWEVLRKCANRTCKGSIVCHTSWNAIYNPDGRIGPSSPPSFASTTEIFCDGCKVLYRE